MEVNLDQTKLGAHSKPILLGRNGSVMKFWTMREVREYNEAISSHFVGPAFSGRQNRSSSEGGGYQDAVDVMS
jgi:hypothetical protein